MFSPFNTIFISFYTNFGETILEGYIVFLII